VSEQGRFMLTMHLEELSDLRRRIQRVQTQLAEATRDDVIVKRLCATKGIGDVTAWTMRAMIGRFDRFATGKQLARFCGLSPRNASSGRRMADSGLIKAGDDLLKSVLIEAAHRLRRYDPRWKELSQELAGRGKHGSVIAAAVANRWVRGLFHQMKEEPA
jgi:transposase